MRMPAATSHSVIALPSMMIKSSAPMKGTIEKYAPVCAVPRWRRPSMKSPRLSCLTSGSLRPLSA